MTLAAHFRLRSLIRERRPIVDLGELVAVGGFLHQSVAVDASHAAARMRACRPIGLDAALMAAKTCFILNFRRLTGVLAERDHTADSLAPAGSHMVAPRAVTTLTSSFFRLVARVVQKYLAHQRLGKFFELRHVASLANFVADIGRRGGFRRFGRGRPG